MTGRPNIKDEVFRLRASMGVAPARQIVLTGPHGAGKTTIGTMLAARLGWEFHPEIGDGLRRRALDGDPGMHAMARQDDFDRQVIRGELERDARWVAHGMPPRVVETWHPGNLAYAMARSPEIARELEPEILQAVAAFRELTLVVQPLTMDQESAARRRTEPGPDGIEAFFGDVAAMALHLASGWCLATASPVDTSHGEPVASMFEVLEHLKDCLLLRIMHPCAS